MATAARATPGWVLPHRVSEADDVLIDLTGQGRHGILPRMCRSERLCQLALQYQNGDDAALELIINDLKASFGLRARRMMYDWDEAASLVMLSIWKAAQTFDPERGHFRNWAALKLSGRIYDWYDKQEQIADEKPTEPNKLPEVPTSEAPVSRTEWELDWPWLEPQVLAVIEARSDDVQTKQRTAALAWIDRRQRGGDETFQVLATELGVHNKQASRAVRWVWIVVEEQRAKGRQS